MAKQNRLNDIFIELAYVHMRDMKKNVVIGVFRDKEEVVRFGGLEPWVYPVRSERTFKDLLLSTKIRYLGNYTTVLVPAIFFGVKVLYEETAKRKMLVELERLRFDPDKLQILSYEHLG